MDKTSPNFFVAGSPIYFLNPTLEQKSQTTPVSNGQTWSYALKMGHTMQIVVSFLHFMQQTIKIVLT
jgi:hypothetical protein